MRRTFALTVALALVAALLVPEVADAATSLNQVIENLRNWLIGLLVALATLLLDRRRCPLPAGGRRSGSA